MTTLIRNCSERVFCESQAPWTSKNTNVGGTDKVETSTMVVVEYICQTGKKKPLNEDPLEAKNTSKKIADSVLLSLFRCSNVMVQHCRSPVALASAELLFSN